MKKHASALALAALLAVPAAHAQVAVNFGGEFEANAYNIDLDNGGEDVRAVQQLLRLAATVKLDDGVQVVTRMNLMDNTWTGDTRSGVTGTDQPFSPDAGDTVSLDLGYLQLPLGPGVLRIGRQESNWANCFVSCDDRRDRIIWVGQIGGFTAGAIYDKRNEGVAAAAPGQDVRAIDDDATGYSVFAVGKLGPVLAGLLYYHLRFDDQFALPALADDELNLVTPYFQGKFGAIEASGAFAWQDHPAFDDEQLGGYLRAGYNFGIAKVDGQVLWTDGYAPNQGWDTFSSLINNSPENDNSPITVARVGPDTLGVAVRGTFNVGQQLKLVGAAGIYDDGDDTTFGGTDTESTFADLQAQYQMTKSTLVWATAGRVNLDTPTGDRDIDGFSLNVKTKF
jgi:hypothetical protein